MERLAKQRPGDPGLPGQGRGGHLLEGQHRSQHPDRGHQCGQVQSRHQVPSGGGLPGHRELHQLGQGQEPQESGAVQAECQDAEQSPGPVQGRHLEAVKERPASPAQTHNSMKYGERIERLVSSEELPMIMSDYLQCKPNLDEEMKYSRENSYHSH